MIDLLDDAMAPEARVFRHTMDDSASVAGQQAIDPAFDRLGFTGDGNGGQVEEANDQQSFSVQARRMILHSCGAAMIRMMVAMMRASFDIVFSS